MFHKLCVYICDYSTGGICIIESDYIALAVNFLGGTAMNKQELIDKQALVDELLKIPGVGSNSDALEMIKRFPSYETQKPVIQQFVADLVDWTVRGNCIPSDVIREFQTNTADTVNLPETLELEKLGEYFEKAYCRYDFEKACFVGYEVEKVPKYIVKIGKLYLKEPLGDTSNSTILTTWDKKRAYPFSSFHTADKHADKFEGAVVEVAEG